jgi:Ca2+-binding EF-hand superfamily protein
VKAHFSLQPLLITETNDQDVLVRAMLGSQPSEGEEMNAEEATRKLSALMEDWRIFTQDDEEIFDRETALALTKHATEFVSLCEENDATNSGQIAYRAFEDILRMLGINFSHSHLRYLQLLFYSENYELDAVPYLNLMSAYVAQEEQEELGEQELSDSQAEKLRGQLHLIATQLDAQGKKVRDAFETDAEGVISPEAFLQGIANLRLTDPDEETLELLFQSLLSDEQEGVHASELEVLLKELLLKKGSEGEVLRSKKSSTSELNE